MEIKTRFVSSNKKLMVYAVMGLFLAAGVGATHIPSEDPGGKNLRVIPKNTDANQVERIMHKMSHDLGVMCSYCHPYTKPDIFPMRVDFVTDELPAKIIARKMMRMTDQLNKKYFGFKNNYSEEAMHIKTSITCNTCHLGLPKPNNRFVIID